jgi:hypothetical protein
VPFNNTYIYNAMKQSSLTVQLWYYFMYTIETDTSEFDFNLFPPLLFWLLSQYTIEQWQYKLSLIFHLYRITVVLKVETDMITSIAASPKDKVRYKWWCMSIPSKLHVIYILLLIYLREWISQSYFTSTSMPEMWDARRSPFREKHINDSMFIRDLEIDVILFRNQRQNIQIIDDVFYNNVRRHNMSDGTLTDNFQY